MLLLVIFKQAESLREIRIVFNGNFESNIIYIGVKPNMFICLTFLPQKQIENISHGVVVNLVRFGELVRLVSVNKDVIDESDPI